MHSHQFGTYSKPVEQLQVEKVEFLTLFASFLGHFVSFGGRRVVILSLKMSVLKRRIEWYAFPSIWNLFKPSRAVTSWKSWILDTFCVFLGSLGGFRGVLAWSYWVLKWASWRDESNGMRVARVGPIGKKLEYIVIFILWTQVTNPETDTL